MTDRTRNDGKDPAGGNGGDTDGGNQSGSGSKAPKTGDNSPVGLYVAVLLAAAGTAGVTAVRRKTQR